VSIPLQSTIVVGVSIWGKLVSCSASIYRTFARFTSGIGSIGEIAVDRVVTRAITQFHQLVGNEPTRIVVYYLRSRRVKTHQMVKLIVRTLKDLFKANEYVLDMVVCTVATAMPIWPAGHTDCPVAVIDGPMMSPGKEFLVSIGRKTTRYAILYERERSKFRHEDFVLASFWLQFNYPNAPRVSEFPSAVLTAIANGEYADKYLLGRQPSEHLNSLLYFL
jgi:hypothetical protein